MVMVMFERLVLITMGLVLAAEFLVDQLEASSVAITIIACVAMVMITIGISRMPVNFSADLLIGKIGRR